MIDLSKQYFDNKEYQKSLDILTQIYLTSKDDIHIPLKINMAKCFYHLKKADIAEKIIESIPNLSDELKVDLSLYKNAQGKYDEAYELLVNNPIPQAKFNLGWHLIRKNKFKEGMIYLNSGRNLNVYGNLHHYMNYDNLYNPNIHGKVNHLVVFMEGGLGDQIIFSRWLSYIKNFCYKMTVICSESLISLFEMLGYSCLNDRQLKNISYDKIVPSMAIPILFDINDPLDKCDMPFIKSKDYKNDKLKIGIKYKGNPEFEHDQFRQVPLDIFNNLNKFGDLYDFQIDDRELDIGYHIGRDINNWVDTYNFLDDMDLIVSSCTSLVHLAASMGKKVIVLTPLVPYFIWSGSSWYSNNVVEVRQKEYNSWVNIDLEIERKIYDWYSRN